MIYAHVATGEASPVPTQAQTLLAHAEAIKHAAVLGGWIDAKGQRHTLTAEQCTQWARDALAIREAAQREAFPE